jgi:hypothetical protein
MVNEAHPIIKEYCSFLAVQMGIQLSEVSVDEDWNTFCQDAYQLNLSSGSKKVSIVVYKPDLDNLLESTICKGLELKIQEGLSRLQLLLEP